ncbi:hypothetical protein [Streptosporangium sp. NPDC087985]|uniref:hypothetical protein n=1 Tax=Streptosporangium sp. NPDC087985 TaxID=3366196 RepID=UPI0038010B85
MVSRRREGKIRRDARQRRDLVKRLLVVVGGAKTEKLYIDGLKRSERNPAVNVIIKDRAKSPAEIVAYAATL